MMASRYFDAISFGCRMFEGIDGVCSLLSFDGFASESMDEPLLFSDDGFDIVVFDDSGDEDDNDSLY